MEKKVKEDNFGKAKLENTPPPRAEARHNASFLPSIVSHSKLASTSLLSANFSGKSEERERGQDIYTQNKVINGFNNPPE
jgi:hypothetical protein